MKNKTKNILNSLLLVFLLVGMIIPVQAGYNIDYSHGDEAVESNNIQIKESTFFDKLFSSIGPFAVYANSGTYQPGQTAIFNYETTSWNLICLSATEVVELYGPDGFIQSFSKGGLGPLYGNKQFSGGFTYVIPSNAKSGSYALAEYLQCNDVLYPSLYPSNYNSYKNKISTPGNTQFVVGQPLPDCTIWKTVIDWGVCNNGKQSRQVSNLCGDTRTEIKDCSVSTPICISPGPNWKCSEWSSCDNNIQVRACNDLNACGTDSGKPSETQTCSSGIKTCTNGATNYPVCDNQDLPKGKSKTLTVAQLKSLLDSTDAQKAQDLPKSFCNIKENCDSANAQCITIGKASSTQSITDVLIPNSPENTIVRLFIAKFHLDSVENEINKYNINNAQGMCLSDFNPIICNDESCSNPTELILHKGINPEDVSGTTANDLIESLCTKNEQCESESKCRPLRWYVNEGFLTEEDATEKVETTRATIAGTSLGAGFGLAGGLLVGKAILGVCTAATLASAGLAAPICFGTIALGVSGAVVGGTVGSYIGDLFEAIGEEDIDKTGYCTIEPKEENFLDKKIKIAEGFELTGLQLILIGFGLLIFVSVLPKRSG